MKHRVKHIFFLLLCALISTFIVNSSISFRNFDVSGGLSDNTVSAICKDKQGFVWFATFNGLCRFDGSEFTVYRNIPGDSLSIVSNNVNALLPFDDGLLIGTDGGLVYFSIQKNAFFRCYLKDADGNVAFHNKSVKGIEKVENSIFVLERRGKLLSLSSSLLLEHYNVADQSWFAVNAYKGKYLLAHNAGGLSLILPSENKVLSNIKMPESPTAQQVYFSKNLNLVVVAYGLGGRVETFRIRDNHLIEKVDNSFPSAVSCVIDYGEMTLMGTNGNGLYQLKNNEIVKINTQNSNISSDVINTLFVDNNKSMWIGTYRYGVNFFSDSFTWFESLTRDKKQLSDRIVSAIAKNSDQFFLGLDGGGLNIYDQRTRKTTVFNTGNSALPGDNVLSVIHDSLYSWLGVYGQGITRFSNQNKQFKHYPLPVNASLWVIKDGGNDEIWLAGRSVYVFNKITGGYQLVVGLENIWASDISFDADSVWISSGTYGIFKVHRKTRSIIANYTKDTQSLSLPDNNITFIHADSDQNIWFSPRNLGLYRLNKNRNRMDYFGVIHGLTDPNVVSMQEDIDGNLWIGTNNGLFRFNQNTESFFRFGTRDNLPSNQFIHNSSFRDAEMIYFGSTNGLIFFNSRSIKYKQKTDSIYIQNIRILNSNRTIFVHHQNYSQKIELPYNHNFFTISYTTPEFDTPDKVRFSCKMQHFDADWREMWNERKITYTNIPPGKYLFVVRQLDRDGKWSETTAALQIVILPPWWRTYWAMSIWILLAAGLLVLAYLLYRREERIRQQSKIKEMEAAVEKRDSEMKLRFFTNISHEFRTPLSLIITPLEILINKEKDAPLKAKLRSVSKNAENLLELVNQLLDFRKLEMRGEILNLSYGDIVEFSASILGSFKEVADNEKKRLNFISDSHHIYMYFDKDKLRKIINNLLSNALKNTNPGSVISVTVNRIEHNGHPYAEISVADNGFGIPEDKLPHIFDRFYKLDYGLSKYSGSGIGLHIVKEYVRLHDGEVFVESTLHMGSTFRFIIPLGLKQPDTETEIAEAGISEPTTECQIKTDRKRILLVEDNDEFRQFVAEQLENEFEVFQASDGQEGEMACRQCQPNLIITDITMPKMDGVELCKRIKNNIDTSHIPVILLTARASNEFVLSGYEAGADEYISKPFNFDILLSRVRKLISQQEERVSNFKKSIEIKPTEITITSLDEKLINDALASIEKNINNEGYSVDDLSNDVGLSRTSLFQKIQSITGLTPAVFIRSIRLKRAAQLLRDTDLNVSEIADYVGFGNIKYFNKHFRDEFNLTPTHYRKNLSEK
jgi:signal transduction histidine kinase/DNA-binding response OmpR family regulator/ligand-binding sensor domain-containing protein